MYYAARSTTAEITNVYEITHVVPADDAQSGTTNQTAIKAWITANSGNVLIETNIPGTPRTFNDMILEGQYYHSVTHAVTDAVTVPVPLAQRRKDCEADLRNQIATLTEHYRHLEDKGEQVFVDNWIKRLVAYLAIDANLENDNGWDDLKTACQQDLVRLGYYASTAWHDAYRTARDEDTNALNTNRNWYNFSIGSVTTRNGVALPSAIATSRLPTRPTATAIAGADILRFLEVV